MIYKYNDELPPDIVEKYNATISDFIKTYPNRVQVSMQENDNVVITLLYGYERGNISSILREITARCRGSLVGDVFRMDIPSCRIVYANSSILRFAGDLNAILEDIPTLSDKLEVYKKPIVSKLPSEVNLPQSFNTDVETIINVSETFKTQNISASKQESMGITTQIIGNKEHVIINPKTVEKYANSHVNDALGTSLNNVVQTIVETFTNSPSITTSKITEKLESAGLILERLNKDVIMLGKIIEKPEDKEKSETGVDEYVIEQNTVKYALLHIGVDPANVGQVCYSAPEKFDVIVLNGYSEQFKIANMWDSSIHNLTIPLPIFILINKQDKTILAGDYALPWICDCHDDFDSWKSKLTHEYQYYEDEYNDETEEMESVEHRITVLNENNSKLRTFCEHVRNNNLTEINQLVEEAKAKYFAMCSEEYLQAISLDSFVSKIMIPLNTPLPADNINTNFGYVLFRSIIDYMSNDQIKDNEKTKFINNCEVLSQKYGQPYSVQNLIDYLNRALTADYDKVANTSMLSMVSMCNSDMSFLPVGKGGWNNPFKPDYGKRIYTENFGILNVDDIDTTKIRYFVSLLGGIESDSNFKLSNELNSSTFVVKSAFKTGRPIDVVIYM